MLHRVKPKYEENSEPSKPLRHRSIVDQINEETKQIKRIIKEKNDSIEEYIYFYLFFNIFFIDCLIVYKL